MARQGQPLALQASATALAAVLSLSSVAAAPVAATSAAAAVVQPASSGIVVGALNFGAFTPGATPGTVTIDPRYTGIARLSHTGVTMVDVSDISDVWFYVSGTPNALYRIYLPSSSLITNDGGTTMLIDTYRCCPTSMMSGGNRVFSTLARLRRRASGGYAAGTDEFNVGATLHVAAHQQRGLYTGFFEVGVGYE